MSSNFKISDLRMETPDNISIAWVEAIGMTKSRDEGNIEQVVYPVSSPPKSSCHSHYAD